MNLVEGCGGHSHTLELASADAQHIAQCRLNNPPLQGV